MANIITNIYKINHRSEHCMTCDNIKLSNKINYRTKLSFTIYIYKELYLYVDSNGNKRCYRKNNLCNSVDYKKFFKDTIKLIELPLENFPFIDKYDQIINQTIFTFLINNNNKNEIEINLIKESTNIYPNQEISYISVNNDINIQEIISFIE